MVYICSIVVIFVAIGTGYAALLKPDCAAVKCKSPDCQFPKTIPGHCCPTCPKGCFYKKKYYKNGSSFKDDCNTCWCRDGNVSCTEIACNGCTYWWKYYSEGQRIPQKGDPCKSCYCRKGKTVCEYVRCPAIYCENPLKEPGACCPVCIPVLQA